MATPHEQFMELLSRIGSFGPGSFDTTPPTPPPSPLMGPIPDQSRIGPVAPQGFNPVDPTAGLRRKIHEVQGTENFLPTDLLSNFTLPAHPADADFKVASAGIIPGRFRKQFADETIENAMKQFREVEGRGDIADIIGNFGVRHRDIMGQMRGLGVDSHPELRGGSYSPADIATAKQIIARDPKAFDRFGITIPAEKQKLVEKVATLDDEAIARMARGHLGHMSISSQLKGGPADIFRVLRHETSHAAEDLAGLPVSKIYSSKDPSYWPSLQEVRARAVEQNYGRDMTGTAGFRLKGSGPRPPNWPESWDWDESTPTMSRIPYSEKVARELGSGHQIGNKYITDDASRAAFEDAMRESSSHYFAPTFGRQREYSFGPSGLLEPNLNETQVKGPRLEPPVSMVPYTKYIEPTYIRMPDLLGGEPIKYSKPRR